MGHVINMRDVMQRRLAGVQASVAACAGRGRMG